MSEPFPEVPNIDQYKHKDLLREISEKCVAYRDTRQIVVPWKVWDKIHLVLLEHSSEMGRAKHSCANCKTEQLVTWGCYQCGHTNDA